MTATTAKHRAPVAAPISILPRCPICDDIMVAAEASVLSPDFAVCHLWTCDNCGCGFVTRHPMKRPRKTARRTTSPPLQPVHAHL